MARRADAVTFPRGIGKSSFVRTSDNLKKHSERESPRYDPRTLVRRHYAPAAGPNLLIRPAGFRPLPNRSWMVSSPIARFQPVRL